MRGLPVYQGLILDVTEHKDPEARLVTAEAELRRLVEQLPVVTYLGDAGTSEGARWLRYIAPGVTDLTGLRAARGVAAGRGAVEEDSSTRKTVSAPSRNPSVLTSRASDSTSSTGSSARDGGERLAA